MKTNRTNCAGLVTTAVIILFAFDAISHQAGAAPSAAQKANANAELLGLWWKPGPPYDAHRGKNVTVAQLKAALDQGADVDARFSDSDGSTILMIAAYHGNLDCVKFLVSKGANVNARANGGWTPLIHAVISRNLACVKFLVSKGADVNAMAKSADMTVLKEAIMADNVSANFGFVDFLVSKGADLNAKDICGETALVKARDHPDIAAFLKAAGAK